MVQDMPERPLPVHGPIHVVERTQLLAQPGRLLARPQRIQKDHMIEESEHADL